MSRFPNPAPYHGTSTDPLEWDDPSNPAYYNYFDPADRDEYDDFAYERSRPHRNLPQTNVFLSARGSLRTSYQTPTKGRSAASSLHSSQNSRGDGRSITPPRPEMAYYDGSPTRSYQDYQRESFRSDSPTRVPLTGYAPGAGIGAGARGYEMMERRPGDLSDPPVASKWLQEEQKSRSRRKWIIIGLIVFLIVGGITGAIVYLVKFRNSGSGSSSNSSSDSDSGSSNGRNGFGATSSNLKVDSSLKKIFPGMDYTPLNSQYPGCGAIQENITADVAILSQLTNKVRLYGTDCDQINMTMKAIQDLKVDMTVFIGVWVDGNSTTLERQLGAMYDLLKTYPASMIDGVAVGNEVLFRQDLTETELIELIQEVRTNVTAMNLGKTIPICTSDLGSNWTPTLAAAVDCVMANIHPFFSGVDVVGAASWTLEYLNNNIVPTTEGLSPKPSIIISEVGWPTGSGSVNSSVAGLSELQYFVNTFPAAATDANVNYYWFEGYDEPWKITYDTSTDQYEDHWGILDVNGFLKSGITLPSNVTLS